MTTTLSLFAHSAPMGWPDAFVAGVCLVVMGFIVSAIFKN